MNGDQFGEYTFKNAFFLQTEIRIKSSSFFSVLFILNMNLSKYSAFVDKFENSENKIEVL